jgi:hypothetical protein
MYCIDPKKFCVPLDDVIYQARNSISQICMEKEIPNSEICGPSLCMMNNKCYYLDREDDNRRAKLSNGNCAKLET